MGGAWEEGKLVGRLGNRVGKGLEEPERIRETKRGEILKETWKERSHSTRREVSLEKKERDFFFFFFFDKFIYLFIFGCVGSSLWCVGFSLRRLLLLQSTGSRRTGFSSCGVRAQQLWLTGSREQAQ